MWALPSGNKMRVIYKNLRSGLLVTTTEDDRHLEIRALRENGTAVIGYKEADAFAKQLRKLADALKKWEQEVVAELDQEDPGRVIRRARRQARRRTRT